jgi:hypothetical protein
MKSLFLSVLLIAGAAMAADPVAATPTKLSCEIPVQTGTPTVKLEMSLGADTSVDFLTLTLTGTAKTETLFMQMEKGTFAKGLQDGQFSTLVLQEGFSQEAGVYKNAGIIALDKKTDGTFGGMMAAMGNIYPLSCK